MKINKPKVTLEFVEKWEDRWTRRYNYSGIMIDEILQMLTEAGVEVIETRKDITPTKKK